MINQVVLMGNIGRDAELKALPDGTPVIGFSICVNERRKARGGYEDRPNWFQCSMFGPRAESIAPYLTRGRKVTVQGRLRYREWAGSDGGTRRDVSVVVDEVGFMSGGRERGGARQAEPAQPASPGADLYESDIPF